MESRPPGFTNPYGSISLLPIPNDTQLHSSVVLQVTHMAPSVTSHHLINEPIERPLPSMTQFSLIQKFRDI